MDTKFITARTALSTHFRFSDLNRARVPVVAIAFFGLRDRSGRPVSPRQTRPERAFVAGCPENRKSNEVGPNFRSLSRPTAHTQKSIKQSLTTESAMDWLSLTCQVLAEERGRGAEPRRPEGGPEDLGKAERRLNPLEATALAYVLDEAFLQLLVVDAAACVSPGRSNAVARKKVADVIEATKEELMEKGSFEVLQRRIREEAEAEKAAKFLSESFLRNQSGIEDLKSKLRGQEAAKLKDMNEKQETIAALKDAIHEEIIKTDVRLRHVDRWEAAAQGQARMRCRAAELDLETKLQDAANKLEAELRVHHEICRFLALEDKVVSEELESWKETYEREMKRRNEKIERLEIKRKEQQILRDDLVKTYEGRQREIDAYLDLKEKLRRERERERFISKMATKIQAWWRGTMVRRGLGAFKKKKKLPKEKKKRSGGPTAQGPST